MSNSEDVSLFEQGVDAWNEELEHRIYSHGARRRESRPVADLSHERLGQRAGSRWRAVWDDGVTFDTLVSYPRGEFSWCDLRGADFSVYPIGYDFRGASFNFANLREANLSGADLQESDFYGADLRDAVLRDARLGGARLTSADLTGADLTATSPWRARLFEPEIPLYALSKASKSAIQSVSDLVASCSGIQKQDDATHVRLYFRGESRAWKLRPSIMRSLRLRDAEGRMLTELMTRRPNDFSHVDLAIDQWVLAQHHGLKTRFLDVTRNPLVALYFACEASEWLQEEGQLQVFAVPHSLVKPYNSDSVSVIANFAKLSFGEQSTLLGKRRESTRNYKGVMRKLYQFIGEEKPQFLPRIDPRDLFRVFVVEPKNSFESLIAQSGAFLVSAFHERFEREAIARCNCRTPVYEQFTMKIPASAKARIIDELRILNITRDTLFPNLAETARAVTVRQNATQPPEDRQDRRRVEHSPWNYTKRPLPPDRSDRIRELSIPPLPPDPPELRGVEPEAASDSSA